MNIFTLYFANLSLKSGGVFNIDLVKDVKQAAFEIGTNLCTPILIIQNGKSQPPIASQHPCPLIVYCTTKSPTIVPLQIIEYAQVLIEDQKLHSVYSGSDLEKVCFCYLNEDYLSKSALSKVSSVLHKPILLYEGTNPNVADLIDNCTEWLHIRLAPPDCI